MQIARRICNACLLRCRGHGSRTQIRDNVEFGATGLPSIALHSVPLELGTEGSVEFGVDILGSMAPVMTQFRRLLGMRCVGNGLVAGPLQLLAREFADLSLGKIAEPGSKRLQLSLDLGPTHLMMERDVLHLTQELFVSPADRIGQRQHDVHLVTRFLDKLGQQLFDILRKSGH